MAPNIQVLNEFRDFSQILSLYNRERFQNTNQEKLQLNILLAVIFLIFLLSLGMLLVIAIWFCFDCNFEISQIGFPLSMCFYILQLLLMYISMASNNRKISDTVNHLQRVIDDREYSLINYFEKISYFLWFWTVIEFFLI